MHHRVGRGAQLQHFGAGGRRFFLGDEAVAFHAVDDVLLATGGALGVAHRVVGRWRLRQAGEHGGLGHRQVGQRLAEVDVGRCRKPVGPLSQEDLVHVDLQDLRLRQLPLDLQGQQDLVDLAGEGLFGAQVEVARHLHGDGGRALALGLVELRHRRARHAQVINTAVAVETGVLDRQYRFLHHLGDLGNGRVDAPLLAEFTQQHAVCRHNPQWQLRPVIGEATDVRQVGVGHRQCHAHQQHRRQRQRQAQAQQAAERTHQQTHGAAHGARCCGAGRLGRSALRVGHVGLQCIETPAPAWCSSGLQQAGGLRPHSVKIVGRSQRSARSETVNSFGLQRLYC